MKESFQEIIVSREARIACVGRSIADFERKTGIHSDPDWRGALAVRIVDDLDEAGSRQAIKAAVERYVRTA